MAIKFKIDIPGTHGAIMRGSPELRTRRVNFWDLNGEGEIVGFNGGRSLWFWIILHNRYAGDKPDKLQDFLDRLDKLIGHNDTLEETGTIKLKFEHCTFEGYEPFPFPGQEDNPGPLKDIFGTLQTDGQADSGWWIRVAMRFRQLVVKV